MIAGRVTRGEVLRYRLPMSKPACPMCGAAARRAGKLRYCAQCGWQKKQTEAQLRLNLKMMPIAFLVMTVVLLFLFFRSGARTQNAAMIAFFLSFPLIALLVSYLVTRRNLKSVLSQPQPTMGAGTGSTPAAMLATQAARLDPRYEALLQTMPPRQLRISRRGKFNLSLTLFVLAVFAAIIGVQLYRSWAELHSFAQFGFREWGMAGFALLLLLMLVSQWRMLDRERGLLGQGEVAAGKIVERLGTRNAAAIKYEFQDFAGEKHVRTGTDYTQKLEEGMLVPVFYDRENPHRQVPACGTFHEVVLANERGGPASR